MSPIKVMDGEQEAGEGSRDQVGESEIANIALVPVPESAGGNFIDLSLPQAQPAGAIDPHQEGGEGIELNQPADAAPLADANEQNAPMDFIQSQNMQPLPDQPAFSQPTEQDLSAMMQNLIK